MCGSFILHKDGYAVYFIFPVALTMIICLAPLSPEETLDDRFVEALHMLDVVDDLMDRLAFGPASQKVDVAKRLLDSQLLPRMEARLDAFKAKEAA